MNCANRWLIVVSSVFAAFCTESTHAADFSTDALLGLDDNSGSGLYTMNEITLDVYGFGASRDKDGKSTAAWGPGVGANYFFTRTLGVGADSSADAFEVPYMLNGSGIYRYPFNDSGFAAYGFGGFGRQWKHSPQWLGHIGVGGEYRCTWNGYVGSIFADIREEFPDETKDYTVVRFGFRLKFK
jgi:hypothetical protein